MALSPAWRTGYPWWMHVDVGGATAVGLRAENQDRWAVADDGLWAIVSDGVGGTAGGATAAELTVAAAVDALDAGALMDAIFSRAHESVVAGQRARTGLEQMAATLTVARHGGGRRWAVGGAGDPPAFVVGTSVHRLLAPHTVAEGLVAAGAISVAEARRHPGRHSITRASGHSRSSVPDIVEFDVPEGASLVLASDGIEVLGDDALVRVVAGARTAPDAAVALVDAALEAGAADNVTVVVLRPSGALVV